MIHCSLTLRFLCLCFPADIICEDLKPIKNEELSLSGSNVSLVYDVSYPYLFWYKQHENSSPDYILKQDKGSRQNSPDFPTDRFGAELKDKSVPLKIQKLELSDSAMYYCALQPTVTGNSSIVDENLWSKDNTILH
uniref:Immunoglobulin V-set domain-containing protein n=1 Tax=Salarias fasciatus TaxID=181472 RepID=A0A672HG79_SALFA